jgi:NAD(P)-dependent dehydrogenase (short-subunit alcohol dehydrogenase family)
MDRKVAFVTGASRGIGRASAIALAEKGFDVVVTARTVKEGASADGRPLPGSIETTAEEIRRRGRDALAIRLDLLDRATTGPGSLELFLEVDLQTVETMFRANVFAQIHLVQQVLPSMLERGSGTVINMVSGAGLNDPPAPAGRGGWGFAYAATKAAFHRMVGVLRVEHPEAGLHFFNLEPGFVITEAMKLSDPDGEISQRFPGAPPEVPAAVVAWLASDPAAADWNGQTVFAQRLALERGLHPDWRAR